MLAGSGTGAVTIDWTEVTWNGGLMSSAFGETVPGPPRLLSVYVYPAIFTDVLLKTTLKVELLPLIDVTTTPLTVAVNVPIPPGVTWVICSVKGVGAIAPSGAPSQENVPN